MDVLAGEASLHEIARRWNGLGVLTPQRNRLLNGTVVKAVLTNPRQAGLRVHWREVIGPAAWPAVLDRVTHERLVAVLTAPRPRIPPRRTPFTGLIRSAVTGLPLDRDVVRGRVCYRAHNRPGREAGNVTIAAEALEALILSMLFTAVEDDQLGERVGQRRPPLAALPDVSGIEDDFRALAEDFGQGRITRAEWLAARGPLEVRLNAAHEAIGETAPIPIPVDLRECWPPLPVDRRRAILAAVFDAVLIHPSTRRGGPAPMVEGIGRLDVDRVEVRWRV